jgi:hypothetical protein
MIQAMLGEVGVRVVSSPPETVMQMVPRMAKGV